MDRSSSKHRLPALPVELWKMVADHMTSKDWARASCTCRTMAAVLPGRIMLRVTNNEHFRWLKRHWSKAQSVALQLDAIPEHIMPAIIGHYTLTHLEWLDVNFCRDVDLAPLPQIYRYQAGEKAFLRWVTALLEQAPVLRLLRVAAPLISVLPVHRMSILKHLRLCFQQAVSADACASLQALCSLESLGMEQGDRSVRLGHVPELDLKPCTKLHAVSFKLLHVAALEVPEGCSVFVEGLLGEIDTQWQRLPSVTTACAFAFDEHWPDELDEFACLNTSRFHNLTSIKLDGEFKDLCTWEEPIEIGTSLRNLAHLTVLSERVHLIFTAPIHLQTFVILAEECVTLRLQSGKHAVHAFAGGLTKVHFRWRCCCRNTYLMLGHLKEQCMWVDMPGCTEARMPASFNGERHCTCGTCMPCLGLGYEGQVMF